MTPDDRRPEPADDDEIADSLAIDEAAAQQPYRHGSHSTDAGQDGLPEADRTVRPDAEPAAYAGSAGATGGKGGPRKPDKPRRKAPWWELPVLVGLAIVIAILVKTFLVQPFYIPSESMEKTLHGCQGCAGDRILVNKIIYDFRDPHPGDIVVFNAPPGWNDETPSIPPANPVVRVIRGFGQLIGFVPPDGLVLVKRVIAMGGQTVKGDVHGRVFVSNHGTTGPWRELHESYVYKTGTDQQAKFGPITVPNGRLWVMGDHRNASADSRYHCGPDTPPCDPTASTVPLSAVIGKAFVIAWPPSRWTTLGTPTTFTSATAGIAGAGLLPIGILFPVFLARRRRGRR